MQKEEKINDMLVAMEKVFDNVGETITEKYLAGYLDALKWVMEYE